MKWNAVEVPVGLNGFHWIQALKKGHGNNIISLPHRFDGDCVLTNNHKGCLVLIVNKNKPRIYTNKYPILKKSATASSTEVRSQQHLFRDDLAGHSICFVHQRCEPLGASSGRGCQDQMGLGDSLGIVVLWYSIFLYILQIEKYAFELIKRPMKRIYFAKTFGVQRLVLAYILFGKSFRGQELTRCWAPL